MARTPSSGSSNTPSTGSRPGTPTIESYVTSDIYSLTPIDSALSSWRDGNQQTLPVITDPKTAPSQTVRNICCIGAGYVGGPTAAIIALYNPHIRVTVVDRDASRIRAWNGRHLPIHEPGLVEIVRATRDGVRDSPLEEQHHLMARSFLASHSPNLCFSTACAEAIANADMILLSVNTPTKKSGQGAGRATDMTAIESAVHDIALHARPGTIIVEKSTVPCKTGQLIKDVLDAHRPGVSFPILSNPEFLSEGTAVRDLLSPDRVIIGCEPTISGHRAAAALVNIYAAWVSRPKIIPMNLWSSELCKLVANAMLAQRISSINSISAICERTGANINDISKSIGMDARIGPQFLKAGIGFGGSCFRKDIASLIYLAESLNLPEVAAYWQQVLTINNFQRDRFAKSIITSLSNTLRGKKITIFGFAFKKNTADARESPALDVIRVLLEENPKTVAIFDPLCTEADLRSELRILDPDHSIMNPHGPIEIFADPYLAALNSNAILVLNDCDMFKNVESAPKSQHNSEPEIHVDAAVPATILNLPHPYNNAPGLFTPPLTPKLACIPSVLANRLVPEPPCPAGCAECDATDRSSHLPAKDITTTLDWSKISRTVREPRWVFDGRGVLDLDIMTTLGFRLQTIGKTSTFQ